jgi:SSS family solute:Na+ symporter/sodium/pantothenate symporter
MQTVAGPDLLIALGGYLLLLVLLGWAGKRAQREETLNDFYLAGRSFGFGVLFLTLYATQYSGNTFMAFPGMTYRLGIGYIFSIAMMMSIILGYLFFAPRLVVLARERRYVTPTDAIVDRFPSRGIQVLSALLLCWGLINYLLAQLVAMGRAMEGLLGPWCAERGIDVHFWAVISLALAMVVYETLGGMRAVAWTDVIQGLLLLLGLAFIAFLAVMEFGGFRNSMAEVVVRSPEKLAVPDRAGQVEMLSGILLLFLGGPMYPMAIQRLYAARDTSHLKKALAVMVFLPLLSTLPVFLLGLVGLAQFPGLSPGESDTVTTLLLARLLEVQPGIYWAVVLVFVAAIAAIMSTADSALLSLSSILTQDLYRPLRRAEPDQKHLYRMGKILSWTLMAILVPIAANPKFTLWKLLELKFEFLIQVLPAFIFGLHSKRLASFPVLMGMMLGTAVSGAFHLFAGFGWIEGAKLLGFHAGLWGLAANVLCCCLGIVLAGRRVPSPSGPTSAA